MADTIRLMSQNQWSRTHNKPFWEERGLDCSAEVRMKGHVRVFKELMPDIMGGQEVNGDMLILFKVYCLEEDLPYSIIWGNMTPIIYRADKFELLDTAYLLFPEALEGYEGSFCNGRTKSANVGVFRNKETGNVFIFATTHLWWKSDAAQAGSSEARRVQLQMTNDLINQYREKHEGCPVILTGDMNARLNSPAIQWALSEGGYTHAHDIATDFRHEGRGYNGCNSSRLGVWQDLPFETAIDHILVKGIREGAVKRFDRYCPDYYLLLSDHAPVYIDIEL